MVDSEILDRYYDYLLDLVRFDLPEHRKYGRLMADMYEKPFIIVHPMDENRDGDALYLRKEFLFDNGYDVEHDLWMDERSVLEVLAAFSRRIEIEITGTPGEDDLSRWFWVMIENLGLNEFDNRHYDKDAVSEILDIWLCRKFERNGAGSIFPLKKVSRDQRDVEMWYQMQAYLNENWEF